ncbi:MAG: bifunctional riboflavin kinase/FAD synthetase [Christensenella sp.]|uniref:bifunctional riboflavin kinase/FAD synthetase n=1 Tax=Christensenella sp. TaxID=1935934 RepID=UPI002B1F8101|nr:bifunctional riboflavin kinase/FAD synthetase [Christensenella sp.]MEA5003755.1 bifunctional riboflavin kinase/FAD synthetase [Christensenella sp.]
MKILTKEDLPLRQETAIAIGLFDGVHEGHRTLIDDIKKQQGLFSLVYTFDGKPNHAAYKNIYTLQEKEEIFEDMRVDGFFLQAFDKEFSQLTKQEFVERLVNDFHAKHITVGFDFRFGRNAEGTTDYMKEQSKRYGYTLHVMPRVAYREEKVSSSYIRGLILAGNMRETAELLKRFYFVDGTIEKGNHLGSKIGFPTANISTDKLLPQYGVYATIAQIDGKLYRAVTNVGIKPTVKEDDTPNIETFILDFSGDVYNEEMRVYFVSQIRQEKAFANVDELRRQIAADAHTASEMLANLEVYNDYIIC